MRRALGAAPANEVIAARALDQALAAGDWPLALQRRARLERPASSRRDGRLLLLGEALRTQRLARGRAADRRGSSEDEVFAFMAPCFAPGSRRDRGKGDPLALLAGDDRQRARRRLCRRASPLLLHRRRQGEAKGALALAPCSKTASAPQRLRIAAAATLARKGERDEALALARRATPTRSSRPARRSRRGQPLPGRDRHAGGRDRRIARPDRDRPQRPGAAARLALSFARLATFLAPDNSEAWMIAAELLAGRADHGAALAAARQDRRRAIPSPGSARGPPDAACSSTPSGPRTALAEARAGARPTARPTIDDWTRLGDLLSRDRAPRARRRPPTARRSSWSTSRRPSRIAEWALWLLRGGALTQAGDWPEGKSRARGSLSARAGPAAGAQLSRLCPARAARESRRGRAADPRGEPAPARQCRDHRFARLGPYSAGDVAEAIALLERAAQGEPADVEINEHLGDAYYTAGPPLRGALRLAGGPGLCRRRGRRRGCAPRSSRADGRTSPRPDAAKPLTPRSTSRCTCGGASRTAITGSRPSSPSPRMATC